jgi:hypothetical protein
MTPEVRVGAKIEGSATAARESGLHQLFGGKDMNSRHDASLHRRRTRFFSMSPRGEIAFPMPLNKGNALCAVKVKASAVMLENVRRRCATLQVTEACLTQFYEVVAVLWMQRNFASCANTCANTPLFRADEPCVETQWNATSAPLNEA